MLQQQKKIRNFCILFEYPFLVTVIALNARLAEQFLAINNHLDRIENLSAGFEGDIERLSAQILERFRYSLFPCGYS